MPVVSPENFSLITLRPTHKCRLCLAVMLSLPFLLAASTSFPSEARAQDNEASASPGEAPSSAAPSEQELATARMHFANGVELLQASPPNYQDAFRQFQLAYQMTHGSWKVLGNLGLCALKLERDGEALAYYETYLAQGGDQIDPGERSHIEREMLLIKGNMAHLTLTSSEPDVRYSVTRQGSSAPPQIYEAKEGATELGLRAGTLEITATSPAGKDLSFRTTVAAGEQTKHFFDYSARPPEALVATSTTEAEPTPRKGVSGLTIAGIATAGVGVLALGGGVVTGLLSQKKESDARDNCIDTVCTEASEGQFDSAKNMATVANVLFISGGVLAATGITLVIVGSTRAGATDAASSSQRVFASHGSSFRLEVTPAPQVGGGGFIAHGTF